MEPSHVGGGAVSEHTSHDVKTLLAVLAEGSLSRDRGFANMIQREKREHNLIGHCTRHRGVLLYNCMEHTQWYDCVTVWDISTV